MATARALLLCLLLSDALPRHSNGAHLAVGRPSAMLDIREMRLCPDQKGVAMVYLNVSTTSLGKSHQTYFKGIALFDRPAASWTETSVKFTKCRGGVSPNNCEYFANWEKKQSNVCADYASPLTPWYTLIKSITPPFVCPIKAGVYSFNNATLDSTSYATLAGSYVNPDITWVVRSEVKDQDRKLYMCMETVARLLPLGRKGRR
ncbi:uncharacterized protein LOC113208919 isoform X2 [Frankliniella occidentalis]|uniref:Uncharacterized protein LOC113208919 isoform X2 n=1 Tax=Frankliniella occidentalis TaxID=133901 RepID=A0A6J1SMI3_FRAOC|nr:uncharacterized protein LOC113208919 isoform X2 [Frankliniella occidentalis]